MSEVARDRQTKRLAADVPDDFFWEAKAATSDKKLQMKQMIPLAVANFLGIRIKVEDLGFDPELQKYLEKDEMEEE